MEIKYIQQRSNSPYHNILKTDNFFSDLIKLYNHPELDPDMGPRQLLNKVQFDVWFYLCRRGSGNLHEMDKETFALQYDTELNMTYIKKVKDELTKNH